MIYRSKWAVLPVMVLTAAVLWIGLLVSGCTDTLQGDRNANQAPVVHFANIPPEGQSFSRNPIVYWYGTDVDGLIDHYRYHVATAFEMGEGVSPDDYIETLTDDDWIYIDVDPASANPQTTRSIRLVADTANPVRGFVSQWVFLQAFDLEGLGSQIVFRKFSRNDNPPTTNILDFRSSAPFVNAPRPGGIVTGVRLSWTGADRIDYPTDPPPFEYQWRLYGPYSDDQIASIASTYFKTAFQSTDGFIYKPGDTFTVCDTVFTDTDTNISCDSWVIGIDSDIPSYLGESVRFFDITAPGFADNDSLNRIADSSVKRDPECLASLGQGESDTLCPAVSDWVTATRDTIYDVFKFDQNDTTVEKSFIFWIRSRDDALVPDPSPAFDTLRVIDPRFERDVFVMDWTVVSAPPPGVRIMGGNNDTSPIYQWWRDRLLEWNPTINFDFRDYGFRAGKYSGKLPLKTILQHKVLILYNDCVNAPPLDKNWLTPIFKGIDAGVNVWVTDRAAVGGTSLSQETHTPEFPGGAVLQATYGFYFAVNRGLYSGWFNHAIFKRAKAENPAAPDSVLPGKPPAFDAQDCMGGYSLNSALWPDIEFDSSRVRSLYSWTFGRFRFFNAEVPYLPEINWVEARYGAEVMYLYKSHYGSNGGSHPLGTRVVQGAPFDYNFEGAPFAHRYNSGLFKTVHMCFTPYALKQGPELQQLFDDVMNFLYDPATIEPVSEIRYPGSAVKLSVEEQRARYWKRCDQQTLEDGGTLSREAMDNLRRTQ